jgi:Fe2+ transport system protein FeoA
MTLSLSQLPCGVAGRIQALTGDSAFRQRIRELGLGECAHVTKIGGSGPFVCLVNGARFALNCAVAAQIIVAPLP